SSRRPHLPAGKLQPAAPAVAVEHGLDLQLPAFVAHDHARLDTAAPADGHAVVRLERRLLGLKQEAAAEALDAGPDLRDLLPLAREGVTPLVGAVDVAADLDAVAEGAGAGHRTSPAGSNGNTRSGDSKASTAKGSWLTLEPTTACSR